MSTVPVDADTEARRIADLIVSCRPPDGSTRYDQNIAIGVLRSLVDPTIHHWLTDSERVAEVRALLTALDILTDQQGQATR